MYKRQVKGCSGWCRAAYGSARRTQQRANDSTCTRYQSRGSYAAKTQNACNTTSYRRNLCDRSAGTAADTAVDLSLIHICWMTEQLADCSADEAKIIKETVVSLKKSLRKVYGKPSKNRYD